MTGLLPSDIEIICEVLKKYPKVKEALFFGSRAKGNHRPGSDIDIAVKGHGTEFLTAQISGELNDETSLPYTFDVIALEALDNSELKEHIFRVGLPFYKNPSNT